MPNRGRGLQQLGRAVLVGAQRLLREPARLALYGRSARPWGPMRNAPGHFYSPLPSLRDVAEFRAGRSRPNARLRGIDLRRDAQIELLRTLAPMLQEAALESSPARPLRYRKDNTYFGVSDALVFRAVLHEFSPRRVVEVGSGWSTAVLLDADEGLTLSDILLVEPYPERLFDVLRAGDDTRVTLLQMRLQDVPIERFEALEAGDVLFVDSSHVSKLGSDVNHLFFDILPRLAPGVLVHVHDIFFPFEYPVAWVEEGRGWNETYLVRAFLEFNDAFEIVLWTNYLQEECRDELAAEAPSLAAHSGGSLWLRRSV